MHSSSTPSASNWHIAFFKAAISSSRFATRSAYDMPLSMHMGFSSSTPFKASSNKFMFDFMSAVFFSKFILVVLRSAVSNSTFVVLEPISAWLALSNSTYSAACVFSASVVT